MACFSFSATAREGNLAATLVAEGWARLRLRWRQPLEAGLGPAALPRPLEVAAKRCPEPRSARLSLRFADFQARCVSSRTTRPSIEGGTPEGMSI
eukprot:7841775-Pyramimonas_sp.AAC.1